MISITDLFQAQKYPKWISENPVFSKIDAVRKIFPTIDLPNFEDKIVVDNVKEIATFANSLLDLISDYMHERTGKLQKFAKKAKVGKKRQERLEFLLSVMQDLAKSLRNNKGAFLVSLPTGKVNLSLPEDLVYKDVVFMKKGAGLFKIYEKINSLLKVDKFLELPNLSQAYQFKNFSSINMPAKETFVKFSAEGGDGIWDIATMSMRGVSSCQTWDQGSGNGAKVIGSMIDPFTGIIYLTTGSIANQFGTTMVRRCIVRYVLEKPSKKPFLLLERMYPAYDKPSLDCFVNSLKKRIPNIPVYYTTEVGERASSTGSKLSASFIPLSDELKKLEDRYYPYCDSGLAFKDDSDCVFAKSPQNVSSLFKSRMPAILAKTIKSSAFTQANLRKYAVDGRKLIAGMRGSKKEEKKADDTMVAELAGKFADFVCAKAAMGDPFKYVGSNKKDCAEFFTMEFKDKVNNELAEYITLNIADNIEV